MKPINLKPWEVRAIQNGATLLVRPIKPQPPDHGEIHVGKYFPTVIAKDGQERPGKEAYGFFDMWEVWAVKSPFGGPGEILWGRETWVECIHTSPSTDQPELCEGDKLIEHATQYTGADGEKRWHYNGRVICYRATSDVEFCDGDGFTGDMANRNDMPRWRPSTQMPLWASRIRLEVMSVRCLRVQELSEADAIATGVVGYRGDREKGCKCPICALDDLVSMWCDTNGPDAWDRNDWVAVCEFVKQETA